jgi:hypothetical protein
LAWTEAVVKQTLPIPASEDIEASAIATMAVEVSSLNRVWPGAFFTPFFVVEIIT